MSWVAVAIGGGAILNYLGSSNAASAQADAAGAATRTQQNQYQQTRQDQLPWMNRGNAAGNQLAYLMGLPGYGPQAGGSMDGALADPTQATAGMSWLDKLRYNMDHGSNIQGTTTAQNPEYNPSMGSSGSLSTPFSQTNWQEDPGYQFRLQEGQKALERSGAAKGMTLSGAQAKALTNYGQGMGSQEYGAAYGRYNNDQTNLFNRLSGISGTGQQTAGNIGQMGANAANQIGQNQLGAGNAAAAGWISGTNAISNGMNQGMNYWNNQNMWNSLNSQNGGYNPAADGNGGMGW